jgi:hypothetical protein
VDCVFAYLGVRGVRLRLRAAGDGVPNPDCPRRVWNQSGTGKSICNHVDVVSSQSFCKRRVSFHSRAHTEKLVCADHLPHRSQQQSEVAQLGHVVGPTLRSGLVSRACCTLCDVNIPVFMYARNAQISRSVSTAQHRSAPGVPLGSTCATPKYCWFGYSYKLMCYWFDYPMRA